MHISTSSSSGARDLQRLSFLKYYYKNWYCKSIMIQKNPQQNMEQQQMQYLENIVSKTFISYFSYHWPAIMYRWELNYCKI